MGNGFSKEETKRGRIRKGNEGSILILTRLIFECPAVMYPRTIPWVNALALFRTRSHTNFKWEQILQIVPTVFLNT